MVGVFGAVVLWTALLSVHPAASIVNKKKNISSQYPPHFYPRREYYKRKSYLETDRPLWVLDDKVTRPGEIEISTHIPFKTKRKFITPATYPVKLPSHYANLHSATVSSSAPRSRTRTQQHRRFPVFDEFEADSEPILIYRGPKAQMIFNTMMTSRQYPMKEPVPGQVMYPPYSPKFKPTPIVKRNNFPESVFHNVTLIPFYAHEAVDPRQLNYEQKPLPEEDLSSSDEVEDNRLDSQNYLTDEENSEPACYHSYYSQDDVQAQYWTMPYTTPPPSEVITPMSLNRQVVVPDAIYPNHRMELTTPMPRPANDAFRIMYDSENESPPPKRYRTVHTAKYGGFKSIYPIYTLNKLLKYKPLKQVQKPSRRNMDKRNPPSEETWLIWDSRHKGTHTSNYLNPMSSKFLPKNHQTSTALDTKVLVQ